MKTSRRTSLLPALLGATLLASTRLLAQPFGQWDFNNNNLAATVGSDLTYADGTTAGFTSFGTTTTFGISSINGSNAVVMRFPGATNGMGFRLPTPSANGGGSFVREYSLLMDVYYPTASDAKPRPILETDEGLIATVLGTDLAIGPNNGVGLVGGTFDGVIAPNTWYRIGLVVQGNTLRSYINGTLVAQQNSPQPARLELTPNSTALFLAESLTNTAAGGYVNSVQLRDIALTTDQMQAFGGPTGGGIPQAIPSIPSFIVSWKPPGAASRTITDLGAVINPGDATVDLSSIQLKLNSVVQTGVQISSNGLITVTKLNAGPLTAGTTYNLEVSFTNSQVGAISFSKQFKAALLFEDFDSLVLGTNVQEGLPTVYTNVWTETPPAGWTVDDTGVPGYNDPDFDGVTEWAGWAFASKTFWGVVTDNQDRQAFTYSSGTVAVADGDEWDDAAHPRTNYFNAIMTTAPINIAGLPANSIYMKFDSSWLPEGADDWDELGGTNNQTALITVSYNGGAPITVMNWSSIPGNNFHDENPNERVSLLLNNPVGATNLVVKFGYLYAANDWWWAFDNLEINQGDIPSSIAVLVPAANSTTAGPRPVISAAVVRGTTTINPASAQLQLDGVNITTTVTTNGLGQIVISGRAPSVLAKLSVHTNTVIYSDSLSGFKTNTWAFTVANYDEITLGTPVWIEEFNGVLEGSLPIGWVATNATTPINTASNLSAANSASYENWVVLSTNRFASVFNIRRFNVRPATLNGQAVDALMSGNLIYGESDNRGNNQVQVLFSPAINLTGISGVYLSFNNIYEQNQDSMGAVEYSINGGTTWLPALYMLADADITVGDPVTTLMTPRADQAYGSDYGAFIGAGPVDSSFEPFIAARTDDDATGSKRIEKIFLPLADNQANVKLRFTHTGTGSWYFGMDNIGLYGTGQVNTAPTIANQPLGAVVPANTAFAMAAGVSPLATRPLTFQWTRDGAFVPGATSQYYTITNMQSGDAGAYRLIANNVSGSATSQVATVTYSQPDPPVIGVNLTNKTVGQDLIAGFAIEVTGTAPLSYQWYFNNAAIAGATTSALNLQHIDLTNGGSYFVIVTNSFGAKTSSIVTLTVTPAPAVEITGQWDFDCASLDGTIGNALIPYDNTVAADTRFGTTAGYSIANIGGSPASVLYFTPSTVDGWGGYKMFHGALPNGGGLYVNRYTIIYDVYYPNDNQWRSLLQTSTGNANDGDVFVNPANGIGISGNYQGTVAAAAWNRIAITLDLPYNTLKKYINGTLVGTQVLGEGLDGRWSLDPFALLFGDEDSDHDPAYVNSVQFRNGVLSDAQILALGGATQASGIPGAVSRICSVVQNGNSLVITWPAAPNLKLQKSTSLTTPNWTDVPGSLGAGSVNDPIGAQPAFYRLRIHP